MSGNNKSNLQLIPGVGKIIAQDLVNIGIKKISCLKGKNPEVLYNKLCKKQGGKVDRCMLYVLKEAVYFAETPKAQREKEKLKWWNWKDVK